MPTYRSLSSAAKENLPVANKIGEQVLCLPIYGSLELETIKIISKIILERK
jgi:dTDP-4-amino-4,6-dideoxygalactose transaminase